MFITTFPPRFTCGIQLPQLVDVFPLPASDMRRRPRLARLSRQLVSECELPHLRPMQCNAEFPQHLTCCEGIRIPTRQRTAQKVLHFRLPRTFMISTRQSWHPCICVAGCPYTQIFRAQFVEPRTANTESLTGHVGVDLPYTKRLEDVAYVRLTEAPCYLSFHANSIAYLSAFDVPPARPPPMGGAYGCLIFQ